MQNSDQFAVVKAVEHFIERLIADYGVELYLAFAWFSIVVVAWIVARNLRRRDRRRGAAVAPNIIVVPIAFTVSPPALPPAKNAPFPDFPLPEDGDHGDTAFSA